MGARRAALRDPSRILTHDPLGGERPSNESTLDSAREGRGSVQTSCAVGQTRRLVAAARGRHCEIVEERLNGRRRHRGEAQPGRHYERLGQTALLMWSGGTDTCPQVTDRGKAMHRHWVQRRSHDTADGECSTCCCGHRRLHMELCRIDRATPVSHRTDDDARRGCPRIDQTTRWSERRPSLRREPTGSRRSSNRSNRTVAPGSATGST